MSKRTKWLLSIGVIATLVVGWQVIAYADSLTGSKFEIDKPDANMIVNGPVGNLDWSNVADTKTQDTGTGQQDTSFAGGEKEDDVCPTGRTGSIPNNKSDLRYFGVYQEAGPAGDPGWLHIFWTRVEEPSGATLMDFEFNKNKTACSSTSPNRLRTAGDLLIEYKIEGGTDNDPDITIRRWVGNATSGQWGTATTLPPADAIGAINLSPISNPTGPTDNSDGTLPDGTTSEDRTFGEASIDLSSVFDSTKCESFGSAMLKSRAGPPFDSTMKDFIAPNTGINIQNCAKVVIRKETVPEENPNATNFGFTKNFATDPTSVNTFTLQDDGVKDYGQTVLLGSGYTVTENVIPAGWQLQGVNCSASNLGTDPDPTTTTATVSFKLDAATDVLDCTYTNQKNVTTLNTNPFVFPNDSASVSNNLGTASGSVTFELYGPDTTPNNTADNCTGTVRYGPETVNSPTNGVYETTNGNGATAPADFGINSSNEGTYWWKVSFTGTNGTPNVAATCNEATNVDVTNGSGTS